MAARNERGQASAELLATVPLLIVVTLAVAQAALVGYAMWSAGVGARAGARAAHVGDDPVAAAEGAVPTALRPAAIRQGARVEVAADAPALLPGLADIRVVSEAALDPEATP